MSRGFWRGVSWGVLLVACGPGAPCEDGCCLPEACDIRDTACVETHLSYVGCRRDAEPPADLEVRTLTPQEFEAELREELPPTDPVADREAHALSLLGLADPSPEASSIDRQIEVQVASSAAFYSSGTGRITLIDRGSAMQGDDATRLLVHELVHASQDHELGLDDFFDGLATSSDGALSAIAMIEGEAELYEDLTEVNQLGYVYDDIDWSDVNARRMASADAFMVTVEDPWSVLGFAFPYAFGGAYMHPVYATAGPGAVRHVFAAPPSLTAEVLRGAALDAAALTTAPSLGPQLEGYAPLFDDSLGQWLLSVALSRAGADGVALAAGWRGDHVWSYERESGEAAVIWILALEPAESALVWDAIDAAAQADWAAVALGELGVAWVAVDATVDLDAFVVAAGALAP